MGPCLSGSLLTAIGNGPRQAPRVTIETGAAARATHGLSTAAAQWRPRPIPSACSSSSSTSRATPRAAKPRPRLPDESEATVITCPSCSDLTPVYPSRPYDTYLFCGERFTFRWFKA
jgi:hypothetical protein